MDTRGSLVGLGINNATAAEEIIIEDALEVFVCYRTARWLFIYYSGLTDY